MKKILNVLLLLSFLLMIGCGGGGGGGGNGNNGEDKKIITGNVKVPNGQLAFKGKQNLFRYLANIFIPPVSASISGLLAVPDGTQVDLLRLNNTVESDEILATTTTEAGKYSFDLDDLDLDYSNDLAVLVSGFGGVQIRAFVVSKSVDIDPVSEAVFQIIHEYINTTPGALLSYFTVEELKDIIDSIDLLTSLLGMECLNDIEETVATIIDAAEQDPTVKYFIASVAQPGQSDDGPGDVGNLFPLSQGNAWNYAGFISEDGGQEEELLDGMIVTGEKQIGGTTTTVVAFSNIENSGAVIEEYLLKNSHGIEYWGTNDPDDFISPQITPYQEIPFLLKADSIWKNFDDLKLQWLDDLDGDGKSESVTFSETVKTLGFEDVSTQLDDFFSTLLMKTTTSYDIVVSSNGALVKSKETTSQWFAAGIGQVKIDYAFNVSGPGGSFSGAQTSDLMGYRVNGKGRGILQKFNIADALAEGNSDTENPGAPGIGSDGNNYLVAAYRETGSPEGLIGILLSSEGQILDEFAIDPYNSGYTNPSVAFDGTNYLVVFNSNSGINGVRVSDNGSVIDSNGGFPIITDNTNFLPTVKFGGTQYLVVYTYDSGTEYDIYGSLITPDGQVSSEFPICTARGTQHSPELAFDGTNYFAVWVDGRNAFLGTDLEELYGARISTSGEILDPDGIPIATAETYHGSPKIAFDGSNYLVVWLDVAELYGWPRNIANIFGKRIRPDGTLMDGNPETNGIEINTIQLQKSYTALAFNGQNYIVAWTVGSYNTPPAGIYTAQVAPSGILINTPANSIGQMTTGLPPDFSKFIHPTLASNGTSSLLGWVVNIELVETTKWLEGLFIYPF